MPENRCLLRCTSPLLAHFRDAGRRPRRPVTKGKPTSRKPFRQSRFGGLRAAARGGKRVRDKVYLDGNWRGLLCDAVAKVDRCAKIGYLYQAKAMVDRSAVLSGHGRARHEPAIGAAAEKRLVGPRRSLLV
jgi:hypothetical protein